MVHLHMVDETVASTLLVERYSPVDKLSVVGGIFGLFLGFSLLSVVELVFWLWRGGKEYFRSNGRVRGMYDKCNLS